MSYVPANGEINMALNTPNDDQKRPPLQFSVELEKVLFKELEKALAESEDMTVAELLQWLLVGGLLAWTKKLADESEREKLDALLRETKIELHVVERGDEADNVGENFEDPVESFRKAWGEAMRGEGMTEEEFERRMLEDAN